MHIGCCRALENVSGIQAGRIDGLTGVWVDNEKVAAIGIRARRWVTYHGLALNVTPNLQPFEHIVPCGIKDRRVTSVKEIVSQSRKGQAGFEPWTPAEEALLLDEYAEGLLQAFQEVFNVEFLDRLVHAQGSN
jgi:lipoyl(octanoyl) transferase